MTDFTTFPGSQFFGDGQSNGYVTQLGTWLIARGGGQFYSIGPGPSYGKARLLGTIGIRAEVRSAIGWPSVVVAG